MMDISERLNSLREALLTGGPLIEALLNTAEGTVYLVGGALRDALLGREILDFDFAVERSATRLGKLLAPGLGGTFVLLDPERDEGRLVLKEGLEVDLSGLGKRSVEEDLRRRDFTVNAMAVSVEDLLEGEFTLIDPFGGVEDSSSRTIRAIGVGSFAEDPIRILRAFRFCSQLSFSIEQQTLRWMKRDSHLLANCAGERVWNELKLTFSSPDSADQLELAARMGVLEVLFPELTEMRSIKQAKGSIEDLFHHSVLTYRRTEELIRDIEKTPFAQAQKEVREYMKGRTPLVKFSALLHDVGKSEAQARDSCGVTHFYGHERMGVEKAKTIAKERLKLSKTETKILTTLIANHMRPHLLAREEEPTQRAMRRFFRDSEGEGIGVLLLSYADGLASKEGEGSHLRRTTSLLLSFHLEEKRKPKFERLITGDDLIQELKLEPSPLFKVILKEVEERQLEGEIETRDEAISLAWKLAEERSP